jgi:hypothetical protein
MMDYVTVRKAETLLAGLGANEFQVAFTLKAQGIKGHRNSIHYCPVAEYLVSNLSKRIPHRHAISVALYSARIKKEIIGMPLPVRDFIKSFDRGVYPELDKML